MSTHRPGTLHRVAGSVVRVAALWAPYARRAEMVREWNAELEREFGAGRGVSAVAAALGAFADANALRSLSREGRRSSHGSGTTGARGGTTGYRRGMMGDRNGIGEWIGGWIADVKLALRGLRRTPGFTAVSVITLAVGIGGSAANYTLLDRVVLDPLPYPDPERLVRLGNQVPGVGPDEVWNLSTAQYVFFTDNAETLESVGLYRSDGGNIMTASGPQRARSVMVTASIMSMLGARAHVGRTISADDDRPSAPAVAMLSHAFWTRTMGADPNVVGSTLSFNDAPIEIIGILDAGVELPGWPIGLAHDLWLPLRVDRGGYFGNNHVFPGIARLAPGATLEAAEAEIERLTARLPETFPDAYSQSFFDRYGFRTAVTPLKEDVVGAMATNLWLLFGGMGLVLLIAAANVTNLFLARIEGRSGEIAIRTALGADRSAIARYLLAEGMTMAALGAGLALVVGYWAVPALTAMAPDELPRIHAVGMGVDTVMFTAALALLVGFALAAYPMVVHARPRVSSGLGGGGRAVTGGRQRQRFRSVLIVTQVALALTLAVGAGLLVQTLRTLHTTDVGFDPEGVLAVDLPLSWNRYPDDVAIWGLHRQVLERVRALPGVREAGMGEVLPVSGGFGCTTQGFENEAVYDRMREAGMTTCGGQVRVMPGYFEALGIPVLEGRTFEEGDNAEPTRAAVVVSRAFADRFWPGENPIGQGVAPARTVGPFFRVVGVVGDVPRASDDGQPPLSQEAVAVYYPVVDNPDVPGNWYWFPGPMTLLVRAGTDDPMSLLPRVRAIIGEIDPEVPLANARLIEDEVAAALADVSFVSLLLGIAAAVAMVLAAVGLYGVIAYVVGRRTREIGMRLAIGAQPREVERMVIGRTLGLVGLGLLVGVPLAGLASGLARGLLVGVEPTDPAAYVAAAAVMTLVALLASWLPARRAASVDPVRALRAE